MGNRLPEITPLSRKLWHSFGVSRTRSLTQDPVLVTTFLSAKGWRECVAKRIYLLRNGRLTLTRIFRSSIRIMTQVARLGNTLLPRSIFW